MKINVNKSLKEDGYLKDKYHSGYASAEYLIDGSSVINFPIEVSGLPIETKYLAITFIDHEAYPNTAFSWVHWLAANIEINEDGEIPEALSESGIKYIGGRNTFGTPLLKISDDERLIFNYGGPRPPDRDHNYELIVYALKDALELEKGFPLNKMYDELELKAIDQYKIKVLAKQAIRN